MEKKIKLSGGTIISLVVSLVFCIVAVIILITYRDYAQAWYSYPENIALIVSGLLICLLLPVVVQFSAEIGQMKEYMKDMAVMDPLTSVYSRRYIDENMDRLIKSVNRANSMLSLMMVDLDFFKNYNETYGLGKGDNCLRNVAKVFTLSLKRDNDIVARYGGEEFIIIMPNTDEKGARMIADRLLKNVKEFNIPHEKSDVADRITISIGITTGGGNYSLTSDDYISKASEALAISKQNGRNRYTLLPL